MADAVTQKTIDDFRKDADSAGEFANKEAIVKPRYGAQYKSAPLISRELLDNGGYRGFENEVELKKYRPTVLNSLAKDMETKKIWRWTGSEWKDEGYDGASSLLIVSQNDPEFIITISDKDGNRLFAIDRSGFAHFVASKDSITGFVETKNEEYLQLLKLLNIISSSSDDPENLYKIHDRNGNILFKIARSGKISGDFDIQHSDIKGFPDALKLLSTSETFEQNLLQVEDDENNLLGALKPDGTWYFPEITTDKLIAGNIQEELAKFSEDKSKKVTDLSNITIPHRDYMRLDVQSGSMPMDPTGNTKISGTCTLSDPTMTNPFVTCNVEMRVQGNSTAGDLKKGYTFDFTNAAGKKLSVKIGSAMSTDSYHIKAFYRDPSHTRDQGGYRVWEKIVKSLDYPYCKINNIPFVQNPNRADDAQYLYDCKYFPYGFPVEIYWNGEFWGLYTMRLKKSRTNYAMNNKNLGHIFLESATYRAHLREKFKANDWEIKSPKMSGYVEQSEIPDGFNEVGESIERLFDFTSTLTTSFQDHARVLNLPHWVAFYILTELTGDEDHDGNNYTIFTWNNTQWTIIPYDMDWTLGWWKTNGAVQTGFRVSVDIWKTFREVYDPEIKQMWTKLRNSGVITVESVAHEYVSIASHVPRSTYLADKEKWGVFYTFKNVDYPTVDQIYAYLDERIKFLDSQWLN